RAPRSLANSTATRAARAVDNRRNCDPMTTLAPVNILGVGISPVNLQRAFAAIEAWIAHGTAHYVNVCTVHTVMECQKDDRLRQIVNESGLSTPDGMPLVLIKPPPGHWHRL